MANLTAESLRAAAREAIFSADGRGFVRFGPVGGSLLVSDAARRLGDAKLEAIEKALESAGFNWRTENGLMLINPSDALLASVKSTEMRCLIEWNGPLYPAQAMADRFLRREATEMTDAGRRLVIETLRLLWQPEGKILSGLPELRKMSAAMLRKNDTSGMREAGILLLERTGRMVL